MKRLSFNIKDRKLLFGVLTIVLVSIFTLSIAYAALNTVLNISGNAEVVASNWNVYFGDVIADINDENNYVNKVDDNTISFKTTLNIPGDYYYFTVDIINGGSIAAIIESIEKKDDLTEEQSKYIKYDISYANGDSITTKQNLEAGSYLRLKVKVEYRTDLSSSDLPNGQTVLNLSFKMNFVQKDEEGIVVPNNGTTPYRIVSGDLNTIGSEICLGDECFYLVQYEEDEKFRMLALFAKYNLNVGSSFNNKFGPNDNYVTDPLVNPTGVQDNKSRGAEVTYEGSNANYNFPWYGVTAFSKTKYWSNANDFSYEHEDNYVFQYLKSYVLYLNEQGYDIISCMLPTVSFVNSFNCSDANTDNCQEYYDWIYSTSYWTADVASDDYVYAVLYNNGLRTFEYDLHYAFGVRPIIILKDEK